MNKLDRYVAGNFLRWFLLVALCTTAVFMAVDFVGNIKMWLSRGMKDAGEYYLEYLPYIIYLSMPIALLITTTASVGNLARWLELTAMQGAGLAPWRILLPLMLLSMGISGGMWFLAEKVLPDSNHRRLEIAQPTSNKKKNKRVRDLTEFVYVTHNGQSLYMGYYGGQQRNARDVVVILFRKGDVEVRYDAKRMAWKDSQWELADGTERRFLGDGSVQVIPFRVKELKGKLTVRPEDLVDDRQTADEMDSKRIAERIQVLRRTGQPTAGLETQWHFRWSGPLTSCITVLIALALSHRHRRSGGLSRNFGIGLFVAFSYYVLIRVGLQMGEAGLLIPWQGAWLGNLVFGVLSLILLRRSFAL